MFEDGIDGFLFGFFDEAAGIDDDHVGLFRVTGQLKPLGYERSEHNFRVDLIFGTAKIHKPDRSPDIGTGSGGCLVRKPVPVFMLGFKTARNNQWLRHRGSLREG
jgi:hypothetical protein